MSSLLPRTQFKPVAASNRFHCSLIAGHSVKESPNSEEKQSTAEKEKMTRLSVNLNPEVGEIFRTLVEEKGLTITEGIRMAQPNTPISRREGTPPPNPSQPPAPREDS